MSRVSCQPGTVQKSFKYNCSGSCGRGKTTFTTSYRLRSEFSLRAGVQPHKFIQATNISSTAHNNRFHTSPEQQKRHGCGVGTCEYTTAYSTDIARHRKTSKYCLPDLLPAWVTMYPQGCVACTTYTKRQCLLQIRYELFATECYSLKTLYTERPRDWHPAFLQTQHLIFKSGDFSRLGVDRAGFPPYRKKV